MIRWEHEGQTIEGIFRGTDSGRYGLIGTIEDYGIVQPETGHLIAFPVGYHLEDLLTGIRSGDKIRIVYEGKKLTSNGREVGVFRVMKLGGNP